MKNQPFYTLPRTLVVLLSGPKHVGKSTFANQLVQELSLATEAPVYVESFATPLRRGAEALGLPTPPSEDKNTPSAMLYGHSHRHILCSLGDWARTIFPDFLADQLWRRMLCSPTHSIVIVDDWRMRDEWKFMLSRPNIHTMSCRLHRKGVEYTGDHRTEVDDETDVVTNAIVKLDTPDHVENLANAILANYLIAPPPNPGSAAATVQGCTCPVMDNSRGRGYMGIEGTFVYNCECPVHQEQIEAATDMMDMPVSEKPPQHPNDPPSADKAEDAKADKAQPGEEDEA